MLAIYIELQQFVVPHHDLPGWLLGVGRGLSSISLLIGSLDLGVMYLQHIFMAFIFYRMIENNLDENLKIDNEE